MMRVGDRVDLKDSCNFPKAFLSSELALVRVTIVWWLYKIHGQLGVCLKCGYSDRNQGNWNTQLTCIFSKLPISLLCLGECDQHQSSTSRLAPPPLPDERWLKVKVKAHSCAWLFGTPWTAAYQAPPSMGFSRQEYWSGSPVPSLSNGYNHCI